MKRVIIGFNSDENGYWRAKLDCGHLQNVRHDPPFTSRSWVLTETGRASRIGFGLNCKLCDENTKPEVGTEAAMNVGHADQTRTPSAP